MAKPQKTAGQQVAATVAAGTPVFYVVTWEEERLEQMLSSASKLLFEDGLESAMGVEDAVCAGLDRVTGDEGRPDGCRKGFHFYLPLEPVIMAAVCFLLLSG